VALTDHPPPSDGDDTSTEERRTDDTDDELEPEQVNPGGQARPDREREDRPYHDGT
jgi:hypothetical protein